MVERGGNICRMRERAWPSAAISAGVASRDRTENAEGRRHRVAAAFVGELDQVLGVEVEGVGRKRGAGGVLDALIDWQDRDVPRSAEATVREDRLQIPQHRDRAVGLGDDTVDEIGSRCVERAGGDRLALVAEE